MKKILVYGLGVTGISSVKTLAKMGYEVYTYDKNKTKVEQLEGYDYSPISDLKIDSIAYECVVKSPGIPPHDDMVLRLEKKYEIISDIELSFRLFPKAKIIGITGTNGKTSTTSMISHILNESGYKAISVGNIGEGILWQMYENPDSIFVCELSSFQLHDTKTYKPHIGVLTNITEDHIDWHGSFDDYIASKLNISKNQDDKDFLIINQEDPILASHMDSYKANVYKFSSMREVDRGIFLKDTSIYLKDKKLNNLIDVDELLVIGKHNYENVMAASLACYLFGVCIDDISKALKTFKSIEHRLEYVTSVDGVKVYNDSKGTNVDSSVKAIESFNNPIIIIAGGYNKHIDYTAYVKAFKKNGKLMVIMGATSDILINLCQKYGVSYTKVANMQEAVDVSFENAVENDVLLLSPASASWDMYKNFELRGEDFKSKVKEHERRKSK